MSIVIQIPINFETIPAAWPGETDFTAYPWPGLLRCLAWSYRLDLPHLRAEVLSCIERNARKGIKAWPN